MKHTLAKLNGQVTFLVSIKDTLSIAVLNYSAIYWIFLMKISTECLKNPLMGKWILKTRVNNRFRKNTGKSRIQAQPFIKKSEHYSGFNVGSV